MLVSGKFDVELKPLDAYAKGSNGVTLGRMSIDKTFTGALSATMLNALSPVKGSAGYVAIEQVKGKLDGKKGSFVLQHYGTMNSNSQHLTLEVIPDSGTSELEGLTGKMSIKIEDGQHFYEFEYELHD